MASEGEAAPDAVAQGAQAAAESANLAAHSAIASAETLAAQANANAQTAVEKIAEETGEEIDVLEQRVNETWQNVRTYGESLASQGQEIQGLKTGMVGLVEATGAILEKLSSMTPKPPEAEAPPEVIPEEVQPKPEAQDAPTHVAAKRRRLI
jgi:hypothetical protein